MGDARRIIPLRSHTPPHLLLGNAVTRHDPGDADRFRSDDRHDAVVQTGELRLLQKDGRLDDDQRTLLPFLPARKVTDDSRVHKRFEPGQHRGIREDPPCKRGTVEPAFRIEHVFKGASWDKTLVSPLDGPGVEAKAGQYITKVNGTPASELVDIYQALVGKVGKTVALEIADNAAGKNARTVYVKPVEDESNLAYYEWVQRNIEKVNKASNGEIGYIHIPDMSTEGLDMFTKLFYTQLDKKALIIDDRMNGGGNVSPMILERLQREVYRMSMSRWGGQNEPVPNQSFYGPKVCLIDKYSSSDGDLFPYGFRRLGLGKLIGKRSWGGIVGISGSRPYLDGQDMRTPFFTSYSLEGDWIIEGHGVDPDIEVDINPFEDYKGKDAQLDKAIEVLKAELKNWKPLPPTPPAPDKSRIGLE